MMDEQTRQNYERAAAELERHTMTSNVPEPARDVLRSAYRMAAGTATHEESSMDIDDRAARLLRECIQRDEVLK